MNKRLIGASLLSVLFGVATIVLAQQRHPAPAAPGATPSTPCAPNYTPSAPCAPDPTPSATTVALPPAQIAREEQTDQLDDAAEAYQKAGNYAQAEADARQAMASGSDSGEAQEILAASLYAQGKAPEALQVYQNIAAGGANAGRNEWPYALLLLKAGHWARAVAAYDTALGLGGDVDVLRAESAFSPNVPQPAELAAAIHIGMGLTLDGGDFHGTWQNRIAQGQAHFQAALALVPNSALTNYYNGYGLQRLGRRAEARVAFQKAAALDQGDVRKAAEDALQDR